MTMHTRVTYHAGRSEFRIGDRLPLHAKEGARAVRGAVSVLTSLIPCLLGLTLLAVAFSASGDVGGLIACGLFGLALLVVGGFMFRSGFDSLMHRLDVTIDEGGVNGLKRGFKGTREWHDSLDAYAGVAQETQIYRRKRKQHTRYRVVLKHASDVDRDVVLYDSHSGDDHRQKTEDFARLLNRPVATLNADGSVDTRAVEDLNKSIRELHREGKIEAHFEPGSLPNSSRVKTHEIDGGYEFALRHRTTTFLGLVFAVAGVGLLYWYFGPGVTGGKGAVWMLPIVGALFALVGLFTIAYGLFGVSTLRVTADTIRLYTNLGSWKLSDASMNTNAIEEVSVKRDQSRSPQLTLVGDSGSIALGGQLKSDERECMRACIIETMTRVAA